MIDQPTGEPQVVADTPAGASASEPTRSRRSIIGAGIAGLAGLVLGSLGRPSAAQAAAGNPLIMGSTSNSAGTSDTSLTAASTGDALLVTQTGAGTALRGSATAVNGIAGFFTSANGPGVSGVTANKDKYAVYAGQDAAATGAGAALRAQGAQNSAIVATTNTLAAPTIKAVNSGIGMIASHGPAVQGLASLGATTDIHPSGVYLRGAGEFAGPNGVIGAASADSSAGAGVLALASGAFGSGVYAVASSASGSTTGVYGQSDSAAGIGISGYASSGTGATIGVYGVSDSDTGYGMWAVASAATGTTFGIYGQSDSNTGYAIYGDGASCWYALYAAGDAHVTNTLTKGGGAFKIDHPLDPANQFLLHSFVESPDMKNVYDGVVSLDSKGEATVTMPDWFEAVNRDFRYQLTTIGEFSPVYIKSEIAANSFSIAGGKAGQRVSWLVTGIRKDAWANEHRIPIELAKRDHEKGLYLHPTENGQPAEKGIDAVLTAAARARRK
jgi:hypothetical protein